MTQTDPGSEPRPPIPDAEEREMEATEPAPDVGEHPDDEPRPEQ